MPKWSLDRAHPRVWVPALMVVALAAPAVADVYAWRTDDGVFAYTDNPKNIPARYADDAVRVEDTKLDAYSRYTKEDTAATRAVAARMEKRLDYLRRLNASDGSLPLAAVPVGAATPTTVTVATGDQRAPTFDVAVGEEAEPVVVEPILSKQDGRAVTRRTTLVKQGDRTLAIILGRSRHIDPNGDIFDEDDLADGN